MKRLLLSRSLAPSSSRVAHHTDEYETLLAEKIAEERSKLPPTPEYLPDLPPHLHRKQLQLNGGAFFEHYSRAYRDIASRRDAYAETAQKLRDAVAVDQETLNR